MSEENQKEETENQQEVQTEQKADQAAAAASQANAQTDAESKVSSEDETIALKQKVEELTKEVSELKDQLLRRAADFENFRKRAMQEKQDAFDYGNAALLTDLLGVIDNFDRTLEAAKTASDAKSIADGVEMINKSFISMLENKYNLKAYGAPGDEFDPAIHEALMSAQGPVAEPTIKEIYLKGYKLKEKPIRLAKVVVTMPDGTVKAEPKAEEKKADGNDKESAEEK
jgi:molecular chaperone GrpE